MNKKCSLNHYLKRQEGRNLFAQPYIPPFALNWAQEKNQIILWGGRRLGRFQESNSSEGYKKI